MLSVWPLMNRKQSAVVEEAPLLAVVSNRRHVVELLVVVCCALNAADKALLPACFKAFQSDLDALPSRLGMLTLYQSMAAAISLPFWGAATARFSMRDLLACGALLWGVATLALSLSFNFHVHCFWRVINGVGLCGVVPVSQAMLAEVVPAEERGAVFGRLGAFSAFVLILTQYYAVSLQNANFVVGSAHIRGWQLVHGQVALLAFALALFIYKGIPRTLTSAAPAPLLSGMVQNVIQILKIPSFAILVLQGVTGGVPWNAMAFMSLYWGTCGFTDQEVGRLALLAGLGGVLGELMSGYLGDAAARRFPDRGRVYVAFTSVCLGVPFYLAMFYVVPRHGHWLILATTLQFGFNFVATWTNAAANKPICSELVRSPAQRAQIVAWWCMLEGVSASILGAPVVGILSEHFGYRLDAQTKTVVPEASEALANALVGVGVISWVCCACVWVGMAFTFPRDRQKAWLENSKPPPADILKNI